MCHRQRTLFFATVFKNIEYCGDQLKGSLDETSFVNRHINFIVR